MIEPKPLTKEERVECEGYFNPNDEGMDGYAAQLIADLLAAEAYWREKMRTAQLGDSDHCPWCGVLCPTSDRTTHERDCAWLRARE